MTLTNGTYINQLIQSGKFKRLIIKPTAYEDLTEYSIAGLYIYEQEENWETKAYSAYTSHEVDEMMDSYRDELDEKERKRNFWSESGYYETDKEKYSRRQMYAKGIYDVSDDLNDTFERQRKETKREEKIRNTKEYEKYLDSLEYSFYFVGYLISNKDCLSEVLINKEYSIYTRYRTSVSQLGESCFIQKEYDLDDDIANIAIPSTVILSKLRFLKLGNMDYTSKRPDYLTLDEWAAWIYAHTS